MDEFETLPVIDKTEFSNDEFVDELNNKKGDQPKETTNE